MVATISIGPSQTERAGYRRRIRIKQLETQLQDIGFTAQLLCQLFDQFGG
jgi:hypothetical protein